MRFDILVDEDILCIKKGPNPLSMTSTVVRESEKYPERGIWISFTKHMGKTCRLISELQIMESDGSKEVNRSRLESIRVFLLYVTITYRDMNP